MTTEILGYRIDETLADTDAAATDGLAPRRLIETGAHVWVARRVTTVFDDEEYRDYPLYSYYQSGRLLAYARPLPSGEGFDIFEPSVSEPGSFRQINFLGQTMTGKEVRLFATSYFSEDSEAGAV